MSDRYGHRPELCNSAYGVLNDIVKGFVSEKVVDQHTYKRYVTEIDVLANFRKPYDASLTSCYVPKNYAARISLIDQYSTGHTRPEVLIVCYCHSGSRRGFSITFGGKVVRRALDCNTDVPDGFVDIVNLNRDYK
jgi:hypothetical protein